MTPCICGQTSFRILLSIFWFRGLAPSIPRDISMTKPAWTLPAVVIGGALTTGRSFVADHLKIRRDQQHAKKEPLRENVYTVLDDT